MMRTLLCLWLLVPVLAGAAEPAGTAHPDDPWESFNRKVFAFNETIDRYMLKPAAKGYRWITPQWLDDRLTNIFQNARDIPSAINHSLQWQWRRAGHSTGRVLLNSTVGIGGLFNVASKAGLEKHSTDLGLTLARWGVPSGPYLVVPGLGPSTVRDAAAWWPDDYLSPRHYIEPDEVRWGISALYVVDYRADLLDAERVIVGDRYTFLREFYLASRRMAAGEQIEDDFSAGFEEADWGDDDGWGEDSDAWDDAPAP